MPPEISAYFYLHQDNWSFRISWQILSLFCIGILTDCTNIYLPAQIEQYKPAIIVNPLFF